jgi:hypothetical protein
LQFSRVVNPVEDLQIWNATSKGFSFVISYASPCGPGLHGHRGFVAFWRPIFQNRSAVKVIGSPFRTFTAAEEACEITLVYLTEDTDSRSRTLPESLSAIYRQRPKL